MAVTAVRLGDDGRTVFLEMPDLTPTWCMEIRYTLRSAAGSPFAGTMQNTIHQLSEPKLKANLSTASGE